MALDPGSRATAKAEAEIEKRLKSIYSKARKELTEKMQEFEKHFKARDAEKRLDLAAGRITQEEYKAWLDHQVFTGDIWKKKVDQATRALLDANQQALRIVNGEKIGVFEENANYQAFQITKDTGLGLNFTLYDKDTVTRLVKEQPELLPRKVVNGRKDRAWNQKKIANAVTQGIIQGESLTQITDRIARDTAEQNGSAMYRYAATAMTAAQNAGRMESMHRAKDMGIKCKKRWLATLDSRTRDTHAELDGQVVDVDEPFVVDGKEIMYPGDPFCAYPELVWNCRCTLVYEYEEYPADPELDERLDNESRETIRNMTYREWTRRKKE